MTTRTLYTIDRNDIQRHVANSAILQRGRSYYQADRVTHIEMRDDHLYARVIGSFRNKYRVEIWCDHGELFSTCTCPYDWGVCKHVAATLYSWLDQRGDPGKYVKTTTAQLHTQLAAIPPNIFIDQIIGEMQIDLLLERYVKRWIETLSPEKLPRLIADLFRQYRANLAATPDLILKRLLHLLAWAESFSPEQAINMAMETLKQIQTQPEILNESTGRDITIASLNIMRQQIAKTNPDAPTGRKLLRSLVGLMGEPIPAGQDLLTETIIAGASHLGERAYLIGELSRKELYAGPPVLRLLARLYKLEGRLEEYEKVRSYCLVEETDYLELFTHYMDENRPEEAMTLGEQGMDRLGVSGPQLAQRLTALYLDWGERELARKHLLRCFDYWPSEGLLNQIDSLSTRIKGWKTQRLRLLKRVEARPTSAH